MVKRIGRSLANDAGLQALLEAVAPAICFVAKSWDYHVRVALEASNEDNLDAIRQSVRRRGEGQRGAARLRTFFDGYSANPAYALACASTAYEEGARWIVLCDTNGGTLPHEVDAVVSKVAETVPGDASRHPCA